MDDILQPLINQPGETFEYGVGYVHCIFFSTLMLRRM